MHRRHCRATGPWLSALILLAAGVVAAAPPAAPVQVLEVGPGQRLKSPAEAAREARDGALVKIQAGFYLDDVAVWTQNDLHITGIDGMARLLTRGETALPDFSNRSRNS